MALTEKVRFMLEDRGFDALYKKHAKDWKKLANSARDLMKSHIESGEPTVDDIKQVLQPLIELEQNFRDFMTDATPKLTQQYWPGYFTDYVLHQVYQPKLNP
jgi:hypothetical protein